LLRRFHAFGDGLEAQAVRHQDDGGDDCLVVLVGGDVPDEALVDFQLVDLELL
jgi:hypothetical protein